MPVTKHKIKLKGQYNNNKKKKQQNTKIKTHRSE